MLILLIVVPLLVLFVGLVFYMIFSPLAAMVSTAQNEELSRGAKTGWIAGIFITGPLAAFIYYIRHGRRRYVRVLHGFLLAANVVLFVGCFVGLSYALPYVGTMLEVQKLSAGIQKLDSLNRAKVEIAIDHLSSELKRVRWYEVRKASILIDLNQMLSHDLKDGEFSLPEVEEWLGAVISRASLDHDRFAARVRELGEQSLARQSAVEMKGRFDLKYVTCKDPSRLTANGRRLNQNLHEGKMSEKLEIETGKITFTRRIAQADGDECEIVDSHKLSSLGEKWFAEPDPSPKVSASGRYNPRECQERSVTAKEIWTRNHVKSSNLLYLQDTQGEKFCEDRSAFYVYDRAPEMQTANSSLPAAPEKHAASDPSAAKRASENLRLALDKFKADEYDQAIALANAAQSHSPNTRSPAAIIAAAQTMKKSPADRAAKDAALREILKATLDDLKTAVDAIKKTQ